MAIARTGPLRSANKLNRNLFVYGTLRSSAKNKYAALLHRSAHLLGTGRVQGRLYRIADYPGLVPSKHDRDWVYGEVYRLRNPQRIYAVLDEYEGGEFRRTVLPVLLDCGDRLDASVYMYRGNVVRTRRIVSGDFSRA